MQIAPSVALRRSTKKPRTVNLNRYNNSLIMSKTRNLKIMTQFHFLCLSSPRLKSLLKNSIRKAWHP